MAVVFISPKQRQKMFIIGITSVFGLLLAVIAAVVLFSQPSEDISEELVFNKPKVKIDFEILESEQFQSLQDFQEMEIRYSYIVVKNEEEIEGYTTANSIEEARQKLENLGYEVYSITEAEMGRDNPFEDYNTTNTSLNMTEEELQQFLEQYSGVIKE